MHARKTRVMRISLVRALWVCHDTVLSFAIASFTPNYNLVILSRHEKASCSIYGTPETDGSIEISTSDHRNPASADLAWSVE